MRWSNEAQEAISGIPFFVRKRVRKKVEEEARRQRSDEVRLEHVKACQRRFFSDMEGEVEGWSVEACFGRAGCPNRAARDDEMAGELEAILSRKDLKSFLKEKVKGPLKIHHEFRVVLSDCPNACSRPQIADIGLIGASVPMVSEEPCSLCGACVEACQEDAIRLDEKGGGPVIDSQRCLFCGQCLRVCPTGTLQEKRHGYRILAGGKLGRHPQLGRELQGLYSKEDALDVVDRCVQYYVEHNREGERLGDILNRTGMEPLERDISGGLKWTNSNRGRTLRIKREEQ